MQSKVERSNFSGLNNLIKTLSDKKVVRIGIFSPKAARQKGGAVTNPELGAIHEFGSHSDHIPARSFLRMPISQESKEIIENGSKGAKQLLVAGKKDAILKRIGIAAEAVVQKAFATHGFGTWAPNAPATKKQKGSDSPLIDTGQLRRSITSMVGEP